MIENAHVTSDQSKNIGKGRKKKKREREREQEQNKSIRLIRSDENARNLPLLAGGGEIAYNEI